MKNRAIGNLIRTITTIAIIAMVVIAVVLYKAKVSDLIIFLGFFVFYIQLPGFFVLRKLNLRVNHISTQLLLSLFSGWVINIFLYFLSDIINTSILLYFVGPVLSIAFVADCIVHKDTPILVNKCKYNKLSICLFLFIAFSLLFVLLNTQYIYLSPEASSFTYMNPDKAYHIGLIDSLSHDYPLESPWIQGRYIKYHIFTEVLYSIPVKLFGLSSENVLISCGPYMTAYVFCLAIYCLFREYSNSKDRAGVYSLILLFSSLFIGKAFYSSLAFRFVFVNENAAGYGIAGAIATLIVSKYWYESLLAKRNNCKWALLLLFFVMLETGIKGPMGAVLVAALWGTYLIGIVIRKVPAKAGLYLIIVSLGFILIYATILGMKGQSNASGASLFSFGTITDVCFWKKNLIAYLSAHGIPRQLRLLAILLVFYMCLTTIFSLPFAIGYIRELILVFSGKKDYEYPKVVIYAAVIIGFVAMFILNYSGHSQIYFGLLSLFLVPLVSFWLFEDLESQSASTQKLLYFLRSVCALMLLITTFLLGYYYVHKINVAASCLDSSRTYDRYMSISNDEYDAMKWIEENTPEDALIATDRYYSVNPNDYDYNDRWDNRFFLYAAYSNRFCYIAGSGYNLGANEWTVRKEMIETNNRLYDSTNSNRGKLAQSLGIDYIVVSKRFSDIKDLSCDEYERCYTNEDIDIYIVH